MNMNNNNENTDRYQLTINEIQFRYLPLSKKRIRKLILNNLDVISVGGKILVRQDDLISLLSNHDFEQLQ